MAGRSLGRAPPSRSHAPRSSVERTNWHRKSPSTRAGDLIARYGGEEFVAVFPGTSGSAASAFVQRLRTALDREPWGTIAAGLTVNASAGVSAGRFETVRDVIEQADGALYEPKRLGRDRAIVD